MSDIDYDELDPGIRETVRRLNALGFETTDSGDGVHKLSPGFRYPNGNDADGEALDTPHVFIASTGRDLCVQADRLSRELSRAGIEVSPIGQGSVFIQANYDPTDGSASIQLIGVNDRAWL